MPEKPNSDRRRWHISKEVPLALLVSLFFQTAGIVWWVAKADSRIDSHELRLTKVEAAEQSRAAEEATLNSTLSRILERLVRIETRLDYAKNQPPEAYDR